MSSIFTSIVIMTVILDYISYVHCTSEHRKQEALIHFRRFSKIAK
jgi:hypothetical protein